MTQALAPGHHLLALRLRSGGNFGAGGGSETVDRPVALDTATGLPYIPWSAIKGVLAGSWGDVVGNGGAGALNRERARRFGSPDRSEDGKDQGAASPIIFGDGFLVSFPLRRADTGWSVDVVPRSSIQLLAELPLSSRVEIARWHGPRGAGAQAIGGTLRRSAIPDVGGLQEVRVEIDLEALGALLGRPVAEVTVAGTAAGAALWRAAVETRMLTALSASKTVRARSLRTIELVPAGAAFVSLVSNVAPEPLDLGFPQLLQLGAWEGAGAGLIELEVMRLPLPGGSFETFWPGGPGGGGSPRSLPEVMVGTHRAVTALAAQPYSANARSILREFGPRWRREGLPSALGFSLAKAKLGSSTPSTESQAHRWCLEHMLGARGSELAEVTRRWITGHPESPSSHEIAELERRLGWLRRYASEIVGGEEEVER